MIHDLHKLNNLTAAEILKSLSNKQLSQNIDEDRIIKDALLLAISELENPRQVAYVNDKLTTDFKLEKTKTFSPLYNSFHPPRHIDPFHPPPRFFSPNNDTEN